MESMLLLTGGRRCEATPARHNAANAQIGKKSALEPFSTPDWFDCDFRNSLHVNSLGHIRLRFG